MSSTSAQVDAVGSRWAVLLSPTFVADRVAPLVGVRHAGDLAIQPLRSHGAQAAVRYWLPSGAAVHAQACSGDDGRSLFETLRGLWENGFNDSGPLRVPEPLGFLEELNVVLMREASGTPLSQVDGCSLESMAGKVRAAARWLLALHSSRPSGLRQEGPYERMGILRESGFSAEAASARPEHAPALLEFLGYVKELAHASAAQPPLTPVHGRFVPEAVFHDSDAVTAVDLDRVSWSDPAKDVAMFAAGLKQLGPVDVGSVSTPVVPLADEFIGEYARSAATNLATLPYYRALYSLREFANAIAAPTSDRPAREHAEQSCRADLQRYLRDGVPKKSRSNGKAKVSSAEDAIAFWSAWASGSGVPGSRPQPGSAAIVQAKDTDRITLRLTTDSGLCLYAKCYPDHQGRRSLKVTNALWASGFGDESPHRVPRIVAASADRTILLINPAGGESLAAILESGSTAEVVRDSKAAAGWLAALHRSPVRVGTQERDWDTLKVFRVPARLIEVCSRFPNCSAALAEILGQLADCVARLAPPASIVQTHGSYRPKHVFVAGDVTTVIDLDRSLPADPAKDVAEFVSDLLWSAQDSRLDRQLVERAAAAFLEEYLQWAPDLEDRVACYSACYLALRLLKGMRDSAAAVPGWWEERIQLCLKEITALCRRL